MAPPGRGEVVEVVAAGGLGGDGGPRELEAWDRGGCVGEEALLDFACGRELLWVAQQLGLLREADGDVAREGHDPALAARGHLGECNLDRDDRAVGTVRGGLDDAGAPLRGGVPPRLGVEALRLQVAQGQAGDGGGLASKDGADGGVGEADDAIEVHEQDGVGGVFPDGAIAELGLAQGLLGVASGGADAGLAELAGDGGREAAEGTLGEEVMGAGVHRADGDALGDVAGDDDEGDVLAGPLEDFEGLGGAEPREVVVGENEVPPRRAEGLGEGLGGFDALMVDLPSGGAEEVVEDAGVDLGVLDDEDVEGRAGLGVHGRAAGAGTRGRAARGFLSVDGQRPERSS